MLGGLLPKKETKNLQGVVSVTSLSIVKHYPNLKQTLHFHFLSLIWSLISFETASFTNIYLPSLCEFAF